MYKALLILAGGASGSLMRYWLGGLMQPLAVSGFPLGTFIVNLLGSFLFGLVWAVLEQRISPAAGVRMLILPGFLGGFTTFSTFMFESTALLQSSQFLLFAANVAGQVVLGMLCLMLGMRLGTTV